MGPAMNTNLMIMMSRGHKLARLDGVGGRSLQIWTSDPSLSVCDVHT